MSTIYVDNLQPNLGNAVYAAGHVVQVKETSAIAFSSSSTTTYTDLLTLSFTPKFSNSLLIATVSLRWQESAIVNNLKYKLLHDSTIIHEVSNYSAYADAAANIIGSISFQAKVTSGSTSARNFVFQVAGVGGAGTPSITINSNGTTGNETILTVMEIAQ